MNIYKKLASLCAILFLSFNAFTQEIKLDNEKKGFFSKPDKHNLTFRLDFSLSQLFQNHGFSYEGERANSQDQISWITLDSTLIDFDKVVNDINFKFDLLISTIEPLNIGLTYHLQSFKIQNEFGGFTGFSYDVFLGLGAIIDYRIKFDAIKGFVINPAVTLGYYISDENFSGKGREAYYNFKVAALYNLFDKIDIRAYTDYSLWNYNENSPSIIFRNRNRVVKSHINHMNFGLGLAYRFHLVPD